MTIQEEMRTPEIKALRERYHELYGTWVGYHWECFGNMDDFKNYLQQKIAEKESQLKQE